MPEENNIAALQKEIAELKKMVQVLGQVAWLMSDESAKSIIDEDDWDLLYVESAKDTKTWNPNKPVTMRKKDEKHDD
jgi:hypothetical protein